MTHMTDRPDKAFLSPREFADRVGKSPETIRRWIASGVINVVRLEVGRGGNSHTMIPVSEIDRLTSLAAPVPQR